MARPRSRTSPCPGGVRSTARNSRRSAWTTLLVTATAVCRESGSGGVCIGQHRGGGPPAWPGQAGCREDGGLVERALQVVAELAVVEADHQPQPGVEPAGRQCRRPNVGFVVVVLESQSCGALHTSIAKHFLRRLVSSCLTGSRNSALEPTSSGPPGRVITEDTRPRNADARNRLGATSRGRLDDVLVGGTRSVTRSPYTSCSSVARRVASASSPQTII